MIPIAKPLVGIEEASAVQNALESGQLTGGPLVEGFEKELCAYTGYKHAIVVSSGTAALHVVASALSLKQGDEVVVPDFTFIATANAARYVGAQPVFADVDEKHFTLDPDAFRKAVTLKTKAVIPVSLYGQAYDVDAIREIARENNVAIISDNAQSIGAKWKGSQDFKDDAMIFSFYPTKNMTTGEGGAIVTDSDDLATNCRLWRNIGQRKPYDYACAGFNYRMPALNAAVGSAQLKKLPQFTDARRKNANMLNDLLSGVKQVEPPVEHPDAFHVYNQYTIKAENRDGLQAFLKEKQVGANVYYPQPLHSLSTFNALASNTLASCPITEKICQRVLSLPVHPAVTEAQLHEVADAVKSFYKG